MSITDKQVTYQTAQLVDLDILVNLVREFHELEGLAFDESIDRKVLADFLQDESLGRVWLIDVGVTAIGYVALAFDYSIEFRGRIAFLDEIYVRADYRGCGIGTATLKFIENFCFDLGIQAVSLEVAHDNHKAQEFYRRAGYSDRHYYLMTKLLKKNE